MEMNVDTAIQGCCLQRLDPALFKPSPSADRLLRGSNGTPYSFTDIRRILARQIGLLWLDVFEGRGWQRATPGESPRQINLFGRSPLTPGRSAAVEVQNNWKTSNFDMKQSKFKTLKEYKAAHPETEVIYGCINDFKDRDYINRNGVRVLTGDLFLEYMLGSHWKEVEELLRNEIAKFLEKLSAN